MSIFIKMVNLAKDLEIEYKILYSYHQRNVTTFYSDTYAFILVTNLFSLTYEENYIPSNTSNVREFIKNYGCIKVDFIMRPNQNAIELIRI